MSQQFDFINLFVRPPGDLIYFLIVVAVGQAAFFMALGHRLRRPLERSTRRYTMATLGIVITWAFLMVGALFALLTGREASTILPPLERAVNVCTILLAGWAFLTADHSRWTRSSNFLLLGMIALVVIAYAYTGVECSRLASTVDFNQSNFGVAWTFIQVVIALLGLIFVLAYFRYVADAPLKMLFFTVLLVGYGVTLIQIGQGTISGDYAGSSRLAFLAALPILPVIIYRNVIGHLEAEAMGQGGVSLPGMVEDSRRLSPGQPSTAFEPPLSTPIIAPSTEREANQLLKALGLILEGATPANIPERIIQAALQILQADIGALLVVQDANYADVLTAHDRVMRHSLSGMSVNLDSQPTLVNAIERRLQRPLFPDRNQDELHDLYTRLDIEQIGPAYFQPLIHGKELLAILVVGLPYARRELGEPAQELLKGFGIIAANLLALSRTADEARINAQERVIQAIARGAPVEQADESVISAWKGMHQSLEESQLQIERLTDQIAQLKLELDMERGRVVDVMGDTEEGMSISQRILSLSDEQHRLLEERDRLASRLREAETALAGVTAGDTETAYKTLLDLLNREKDELVERRAQLEAQLAELRAREGGFAPEQAEQMLARMSDDKARLEAERDRLTGRLGDIETQMKALGMEVGSAGLAQFIVQLFQQRATLEARSETLQRERDALAARARLGTDVDDATRDQQMAMFQNEIRNLASDREALTRQYDRLRGEHEELVAKQDMLKEQRARLTAEIAGFEQELSEAYDEQTRLREQLQTLANQRSALMSERTRLIAEKQALETERDQLKARLGGDRERVFSAGEEGVGSLTRMIDDLSNQRDAIERELTVVRAQLDERDHEIERLKQRLDARQPAAQTQNPDVFVGMVQELRTPMTSIVGYVDLLLGESAGILGEMQRKFLQRVNANVTRLTAMLEDLVHLTVLDTGQFVLSRQPVDVVGAIEDAITDAAAQLREKGLTVHLNLADDVPALPADPDAIHQIIGQLLTNAYLASPPGGDIFVTARRQRVQFGRNGSGDQDVDSLFVSVEDRGGGISPEDQARVFNRKYKAENPLIQGLGDTGVGLSIAKALVEAHGGKIWLESREEIGSAFNFALPIEPVLEAQGS